MRNRLFIAFFTTLYFSLNLFATTSEELAKKLIKAYPDFLEKYENNYIYFKNGDKIIFSSPKNYTNYEDKLVGESGLFYLSKFSNSYLYCKVVIMAIRAQIKK